MTKRSAFRTTCPEVLHYFESLYIQDQHDSDTTAERARELRTAVTERLAALS
jgi:hypothetical protein